MLDTLKYGDFVRIGSRLQLINFIERKEGYTIVYCRDMKSGRERKEFISDESVKRLNIQKVNFEYLKEEDYNCYFRDLDTNEVFVLDRIFLGTDLDYILGTATEPKLQLTGPVYTNVNWDNIKPGTELPLFTDDEDATIYYTIDGTVPTFDSMIYEKPFVITENMMIRAFAYREGKNKSYTNTFSVMLRHRPIKIYLSPSRQILNHGIEGSGYTVEGVEMNRLVDELQPMLEKYDVMVYRNNPDTFIADWAKEGREHDVDLHLAIHSNATTGHWKKGVENWIHDSYSETYSLAKLIYNNVYSIYYDNKNPLTDRGIKYAKGDIKETSPVYVKFGMNLEIAYHDNMEDAKWMIEKRTEIAEQIVKALVDYYQLELKKD